MCWVLCALCVIAKVGMTNLNFFCLTGHQASVAFEAQTIMTSVKGNSYKTTKMILTMVNDFNAIIISFSLYNSDFGERLGTHGLKGTYELRTIHFFIIFLITTSRENAEIRKMIYNYHAFTY